MQTDSPTTWALVCAATRSRAKMSGRLARERSPYLDHADCRSGGAYCPYPTTNQPSGRAIWKRRGIPVGPGLSDRGEDSLRCFHHRRGVLAVSSRLQAQSHRFGRWVRRRQERRYFRTGAGAGRCSGTPIPAGSGMRAAGCGAIAEESGRRSRCSSASGWLARPPMVSPAPRDSCRCHPWTRPSLSTVRLVPTSPPC